MDVDEIALEYSRGIMELVNGNNPGGDVQLQAKIQCYLIEQIRIAQPQYWELWCHDETCAGRWFLVERSDKKLLARKNQMVIPFYTHKEYPPAGLPK